MRLSGISNEEDFMNRQEAAQILLRDDLSAVVAANAKWNGKGFGVFALGFMLYYATVIVGAVEWCKKASIDLTASIDQDLLEKLRAKIKLYSSDNAIPLSDQITLMSKIIDREKQYWKGVHSQSIFRFLPLPDVGVYVVNGHCICNTLEYAYELTPFNPNNIPIFIVMGGEVKEDTLSFRYGYMIGEGIADISRHLAFDVEALRIQEPIRITPGRFDFNLSRNRFLKNNANGIFAFNLLCRINFLLEMLIPTCPEWEMFTFRMIYVTFYHLQFDLQNLDLGFIHYNMPYRDRIFRNAMAHYSLFGKIEDNEIMPDVIGLGIFEKFFGKPFKMVNSAIIEEFKKTRDSLEEYVQVKGRVIYD